MHARPVSTRTVRKQSIKFDFIRYVMALWEIGLFHNIFTELIFQY